MPFVTEVWLDDKLVGVFSDNELDLWFTFYYDESRDYRMFVVEESQWIKNSA